MYRGDRSRKETLVEYGFRLPSALDNRPLRFDEFERVAAADDLRLGDAGGATSSRKSGAGGRAGRAADRAASIPRWKSGRCATQVDDLLSEITAACARDERVLVTTLTKRMAEDLTEYLARARRQGPLPAFRHRDRRTSRDHPRPAARRSSTCSSASTCCARASTCPRCRWSRSSTPTRRASCAPRAR